MYYKEEIEEPDIPITNRHSPIPWPYIVIVRERVNDDGSREVVSRKRVYSHILGGCEIVEEEILRKG